MGLGLPDAGDGAADTVLFDRVFATFRAIAGVCAWASIIITTGQIYKHLKHYNNPRHQKCT